MKVFVNFNDKRWKRYLIDFDKVANTVVGKKYKNSEISIILTDDKEIHALNKMYRNIDKPTNVLSFELDDDILLGDIYISLDTVKRESELAKISVEEHVAHMVVHGVLHLLGYDHLTNVQAKIMETKEIHVLKKLGIQNPYSDTCVFSWWKYVLCALFGIGASFGFAPFNMWWLTILFIAGAYWLLCNNEKVGFWCAWKRALPFGVMYAISMFWWMLHSIYVVPELMNKFAIWTIPGLVGIGIVGAAIFTIPFVLTLCIYSKTSIKPVLFACGWTVVLWFREWIFTGFPWNPIANIMLPYPIISNSMSVFGALGLTFVLIGLLASVVQCLKDRYNKATCFVLVSFIVLMCFGMFFGYKNIKFSDIGDSSINIRIVQPVTTQKTKITLSRFDAVNLAKVRIEELTTLAGDVKDIDLVVYPETTYPFVLVKNDILPISKDLHRPVIIGANVYDNNLMYNSLVVTDEYGKILDIYNKSHLVPFGEYGPIKFIPAPVNLTPGEGRKVITNDFGSGKYFVFAPAVCYEIIFSDSVIKSSDVDAIINITNDTWFGRTPGVYQHLDMVRRAAIESGIPIVRANYSGISAFVSADGEIKSYLPIGQIGVLDGTVHGSHMTIYRLLGRDMWIVIIVLVSIGVGLIAYILEDKDRNL